MGLFFIVKFFVDFAELFIGDMRIDLRGCDRSVAEHCLDGANIGAVAEEVGGVGVAQSMRADFFAYDACLSCIFLDYSLDTARS